LRKFLAHFGIIFFHQIFDCFDSGCIIESKLEIIGRALYLQQQKIDQSFFNRLLYSKANSSGGFPGAENRKNEANFDGI
jgi:hypothetical protein